MFEMVSDGCDGNKLTMATNPSPQIGDKYPSLCQLSYQRLAGNN